MSDKLKGNHADVDQPFEDVVLSKVLNELKSKCVCFVRWGPARTLT